MGLSIMYRHVLEHWQLLAQNCGDRRVEVVAGTNQQRVYYCSVATRPVSGRTRLMNVLAVCANLCEDQVLFEGEDYVNEERGALSVVVQGKVGAQRYASATTLVVTRRALGWKNEYPICTGRDRCVSCRDLRQDTGE